MSGEGSIARTYQNFKQNRGRLKGRTYRDMKDLMRSYSGKTILDFRNIEPAHLFKIKEKIRTKARRDQQKLVMMYLLSAIITFVLISIIFQYAWIDHTFALIFLSRLLQLSGNILGI